MENNFEKTTFFLGLDVFNGYRIVEHAFNEPQGMGALCFMVADYWVAGEAGSPALYNDTYVRVSREVYKCAMRMFREVKEQFLHISGVPIPADRGIRVGDYIEYKKLGGKIFLHIINVSLNKCHAKIFYTTKYDMDIGDNNTLENLDVTIEELKADGRLITKEVYEEALAMAEAAIHQIKSYLKVQYENNRK